MAAAGEWLNGDQAGPGEAAGSEWFGGEEAAKAACLKLLTSAPRTRAQLAAALRRRRVPDEIAESVLARFAEVGLIDDAAFATGVGREQAPQPGTCPQSALAAELRQRLGLPTGRYGPPLTRSSPEMTMAAARRLVMKRIAATRGRPL